MRSFRNKNVPAARESSKIPLLILRYQSHKLAFHLKSAGLKSLRAEKNRETRHRIKTYGSLLIIQSRFGFALQFASDENILIAICCNVFFFGVSYETQKWLSSFLFAITRWLCGSIGYQGCSHQFDWDFEKLRQIVFKEPQTKNLSKFLMSHKARQQTRREIVVATNPMAVTFFSCLFLLFYE